MSTALHDLDDAPVLSRACCLEHHQPSYDTVRQKSQQTNQQRDHYPRTGQRSLQPTVEDVPDEDWQRPTGGINSASPLSTSFFENIFHQPNNTRRRTLDQTASDWEVPCPTKKRMRGMGVCPHLCPYFNVLWLSFFKAFDGTSAMSPLSARTCSPESQPRRHEDRSNAATQESFEKVAIVTENNVLRNQSRCGMRG